MVVIGAAVYPGSAAKFRTKMFPLPSYNRRALQGPRSPASSRKRSTGVRVVKAFGQEAQEQEALSAESKVLFPVPDPLGEDHSGLLRNLWMPFPGLAQIGMLALGGWLVMQHHITLGVFPGVLQLCAAAGDPRCSFLSSVLTTSQQAPRPGAARLLDLLAATSAVQHKPDAVTGG